MSISTLASHNYFNGQTLRKQYKEILSDYRTWEQLKHTEEYLLFPENMGENLSLDETCLSNGDVYTILTNKAAHGRKGAIVAIVKGVASDVVSAIFKILPHKSRIQVQTITTDLSSAMMLTARRCFPAAKLINDRFHVQQLMSEAVDQIRIGLRWQILDEENKKIKEHRLKRKNAKTKLERERIGLWTPIRMSNGETMAQIIAKSKHIILKNKSKWNQRQSERAEILFEQFPLLKKAYDLSMKLTEIFNRKIKPEEARLSLTRWYNEVEGFGDNNLNRILDTFENHNITIINYFDKRLTNASAESFNAKIKALRSQFRGVSDIKFFMYRLTKLYA
ncbi:MAG: ISAon1 family transposase [Tannerellaceae bacterium]